jgi:hypothetical protein
MAPILLPFAARFEFVRCWLSLGVFKWSAELGMALLTKLFVLLPDDRAFLRE